MFLNRDKLNKKSSSTLRLKKVNFESKLLFEELREYRSEYVEKEMELSGTKVKILMMKEEADRLVSE